MITNERQFKIAKTQMEKFRLSIAHFDTEKLVKDGTDRLIAQAQLEQMQSEYEVLLEQIREYEHLSSGAQKEFEMRTLHDLPVALIKARIANNWTQKQLAEVLGVKEQQVQRYEAEMYQSANIATICRTAEALGLDIPDYAVMSSTEDDSTVGLSKNFPITEMYKRGWFEDFSGTLREAKKSYHDLIRQLYFKSGYAPDQIAMHRKKVRMGSNINEASLMAWHIRVLCLTNKQKLSQTFNPNVMSQDWFRELAKLSRYTEGPLLARDWLLESGIYFVIETHLPQTYLDGGALRHPSGAPIVALTLRYDRLDNFWFVLFHELSHIHLHFQSEQDTDFFDDSEVQSNDIELEADKFALNALVPLEMWNNCLSRFSLDTDTVRTEAEQFQVHPSLIAGRIRHERQNFTILNDVIGHGEVSGNFKGWIL